MEAENSGAYASPMDTTEAGRLGGLARARNARAARAGCRVCLNRAARPAQLDDYNRKLEVHQEAEAALRAGRTHPPESYEYAALGPAPEFPPAAIESASELQGHVMHSLDDLAERIDALEAVLASSAPGIPGGAVPERSPISS